MAGFFFTGEEAAALTPKSVDRRRALLDALWKDSTSVAPVQHWTQGAARLANALANRMEENRLDTAETKGTKDANAALLAALGMGSAGASSPMPAATPEVAGASASAPAASPAPRETMASDGTPLPPVRPASLGGQATGAPAWAGGLGNTSLSFASPPMPTPAAPTPPGAQPSDRELAVRTIAAETSGNPAETQGIAAVIANRLKTGKWGSTLGDVVLATNQFEPWNKPGARNDPMNIDPASPRYKQAESALAAALSGQDPTNGATHFFAPAAQAALGRNAPSWAQGGGQRLGATAFYAPEGRATGPLPAQVAQADAPAPEAAQAQFNVPGQQAQAGGGNRSAALIAALSNPWASQANPALAGVAQKMLGDQLTGSQFGFQVVGDQLYRTNPKTGEVMPMGVTAEKPIALGEGQRLVNPKTGQVIAGNEDNKITRDIKTREQEIRSRGIDPSDPTAQRYILTGQLPDPEIKPDERKMIAEAEDAKTELRGTIEGLRRARELAPQAYSGFGATIRGNLGANLPGPGMIFDEKAAKATVELNKLLSQEAIAAMSASLKGATTDNEMRQFTNILADANASPELKIRTIDRMLKLAESKATTADERIQGIRAKTYFQPQKPSAPAAPPKQQQQANPLLDEARAAIAKGADPEKVRARLKERGIDPGAL